MENFTLAAEAEVFLEKAEPEAAELVAVIQVEVMALSILVAAEEDPVEILVLLQAELAVLA